MWGVVEGRVCAGAGDESQSDDDVAVDAEEHGEHGVEVLPAGCGGELEEQVEGESGGVVVCGVFGFVFRCVDSLVEEEV